MRAVLNRLFSLDLYHTTVRRELFAGLATFSTMIYIIFVNPRILSQAGMNYEAVMGATIIISAISSILMGIWANYPFALAPGMGINAYIAYAIIIDKQIPWQQALGACFWSGVIFLLLNITGVRKKIMDVLPVDLRIGTAGGIGLFLAFLGFKSVEIVVPNPNTILSLGDMSQPQVYLTGVGVVLITSLLALRINGAIFITTMLLWVIGLLFGLTEWQGFFGMPPSIAPTLMQADLMGSLRPELAVPIISLVFVMVFDTAGTISALLGQGILPVLHTERPRLRRAMDCDAIGTMLGGLLGTAPITTYLESVTGMTAGGRTGLTAVVVGILFLFALFLAPFAASIPPFATAPALIVLGALMLKGAKYMDWSDPTEYIPGFIILITIPMTFSISAGISLGILTYPIVKVMSGKAKQVHWLVYLIALLFSIKFLIDRL